MIPAILLGVLFASIAFGIALGRRAYAQIERALDDAWPRK